MSAPGQIIVLGSSLTALAVVRNAAALGLRVVVADTTGGVAFSSQYVDERWQLDRAQLPSLAGRIRRLATDAATALIADSDDWLVWLLGERAALADGGVDVLHPDNAVLSLCLDKLRFSTWCAEQGLPCPPAVELADAGSELPFGFPVFVRPRTTRHAELAVIPKAAVANNPVELRVVMERFARGGVGAVASPSLLAEGLRQFSYGFARRADGAQCGLLTEKLRPRPDQCATGSLVTTAQHPELLALGRRTAEALDFCGIGEVELLHNDRTGVTQIVELNARPWLQYSLAVHSGVDLLRFVLDPATRVPSDSTFRPLRWISLNNDLYHCFSRKAGLWRRGQLSLREYFRSLAYPRIWATWCWKDPGPTIALLTRAWRERRSSGGSPAAASPTSAPAAARRVRLERPLETVAQR